MFASLPARTRRYNPYSAFGLIFAQLGFQDRGETSMQYTKPMIDLVYEIRRRVDANMKPSVKMANPDMLKELADYHHHTKDTITKTLIKELLFLAGTQWQQLLEPTQTDTVKVLDIPKQMVKVYRGQTTLVDAPHATEEGIALRSELLAKDIPPPVKTVRMYRGHPVL